MNDAERDAWLREALRHAPDADALPPSGVSESILLKARAAARAGATPTRSDASRVAPASAFGRFWSWLARPPVAGAFASIMAATLVGLMWWDRPMDETLVPPPAPASVRRADAAPAPVTSPGIAAQREVARSPAPSVTDKAMPAQEAMREARVASTPPATTSAKLKSEPLAKEQAGPATRKSETPAPFPSAESQRPTSVAPPPIDAAKKDSRTEQRAATESSRSAAAANVAEADALGRGGVASGGGPAPDAATGRLSAPSAASAEALQRQRVADDERDKSVAGFAAEAPKPFRSAPAPTRAEGGSRSASPLATVLAAISADPSTWSRRTAGGDSFALDAGWRAWLSELDAAAAGRWRAFDAGATSGAAADGGERDGTTTTLRLVEGGGVAAVIRVEGTTVQVELPGGAGRWRATLSPDAADRLRTSAQRLAR